AAVAGARALRASRVIQPTDRVAAILTGHVLKDPGIVERMHGAGGLIEAPNRPVTIDPTLEAISAVIDG
ncbi:MAG: threonine synthase, partial [Gemmatimonadetes bacterium]|nr:threonine synthase [Gemmatimonadota bacterium]